MSYLATNKRNAFTLLEIIIAASLTTTLLLILWSLFGIYSKLEEKGSRATTEIQLARGLLRQLQSDLCRLTVAPASMTAGSSAAAAQSQPTTTVSSVESHDRLVLPAGVQLVGDHNRIELVLAAQPTDDDLRITDQSLVTSPAVFKIVQYHWQAREDLPGLAPLNTTRNETLHQDLLPPELPPTGLRRQMCSWSSRQRKASGDKTVSLATNPGLNRPLKNQADPHASVPEQDDLVPEVSAWQLQYFDGARWLNQWNSASLGQLPVAVKVSFNLEPLVKLGQEPIIDSATVVTEPPSRAGQLPANNLLEDQYLFPDSDSSNPLKNSFEYQFVIAINTPGLLPEEAPEEP